MKSRLFISLLIGLLITGTATISNAALIANWSFNEGSGTTAHDSAGGINGTLTGGVGFVTDGVKGGSIKITDGFVNMGNNFQSSQFFSIQAWVKIENGNNDKMFPVAKHGDGARGYILFVNTDDIYNGPFNTTGFYSSDGNTWTYKTAYGSPVNDGLWHQLVGIYENGTTKIYVDGALSGQGVAGFSDSNTDFIIGGFCQGGIAPINLYHGFIDEVSVYNHALTDAEVKVLYDSYLPANVPVPSTIFLLGSGILGLAGLSRKRRSN